MKPVKITYQTFPPCDIAVVLCAGPSLNDNIKKVKSYCEGRKMVVLGANYNYPIPSDYTVFMDRVMFAKLMPDLCSPNIIVTNEVYQDPKCQKLILADKRHKYYFVNTNEEIAMCRFHRRAKEVNLTSIVINENGDIDHKIGNSGHASLLISHFFSPKEVLVLGFDGPQENNVHIEKFNAPTQKFSDMSQLTIPDKRNWVCNLLVPYLQNRGILVSAYQGDKFWGIKPDAINFIK